MNTVQRLILCTLFSPFLCLGASGGHHHHSHQKAHVHGEGKMQVVIEAKQLVIDILIPAQDIVGFEHAPKTQAEKDKIQNASKTLAKADVAVKTPLEAKCTLSGTPTITSDLLKADAKESHSEFKAQYKFSCASIEKLDSIDVKLFESFKGLKELEAEAATDGGQKSQTLTAAAPTFKLR